MVDKDLLAKARAGDKTAVRDLLSRYTPMVKSIASHFFLTGGDGDDLFQEGMVGLYSALGSYNPDSQASFTTYAYICVRNAIRDAVKKDTSSRQSALNNFLPILEICDGLFTDNPEDEVIRQENRREFLQKISGPLSSYEFQVIIMYMDGMGTPEISDSLGKKGKSVDNALARAKAKIGKLYQAEE